MQSVSANLWDTLQATVKAIEASTQYWTATPYYECSAAAGNTFNSSSAANGTYNQGVKGYLSRSKLIIRLAINESTDFPQTECRRNNQNQYKGIKGLLIKNRSLCRVKHSRKGKRSATRKLGRACINGTGYSLKEKNKAKPDKTEHGFGKSAKN
ncbi:hypothetical protein Tco_1179452 [Tanacetum coccineum]